MDLLSHKDRTPIPTISILLDDERRSPFRPGEPVRGRITLHTPTPRTLQHAEALFFGRTVTHCTRIGEAGNWVGLLGRRNFSTNQTIHYHDDASLLRFTQNLADAVTLEPDRPCSFHFDFMFGDSAKLVGASPWRGPTTGTGVYAQGLHPLPPSCDRTFNDHHYARVEYFIQAVFYFTDTNAALTAQLPLDFAGNAPWPDPNSRVEITRPPEIFSSPRLLNDQKSSLRHSLKIGGVDAPSVCVALKTTVNTQVIAGSLLPLDVCVELTDFSTSAISIPDVELRIKSCKLHQVTFFRAREVRARSDPPEYQEIGEDKVTLRTMPEQISAKGDVKPHSTVYSAIFQAEIPARLAPSFRTFNINHNYQLSGEVVATICGKKFEQEFGIENIIMHPRT